MFNKTTDRIGSLFDLVCSMTHYKSSFQEKNQEKIRWFYLAEKSIILILFSGFFISLIIALMLYYGIATERSALIFNISWGSVGVLSVVLFLFKVVERKKIHNIDTSGGFLHPKIHEFRDNSSSDLGFVNELLRYNKKELEITLMQYRSKWIPEKSFFDFLSENSIFFPAIGFFISVLTKDFFKGDSINEFVIIFVLAMSVIVFLFYRRLDTSWSVGKKQRHSHVVRLLEYAVCLKSEEKINSTIAPAAPSIPMRTPEKPTGLLGRLLRDVCK